MTRPAIVQSAFDFAMREINALEGRIVTAEDDTDAMLWEQARQVVAQLDAGQSQRQVAAQWINARTGEPYSQMHVSFTARLYREKFTFQPRPRFRDAYNAVANAPSRETPEAEPTTEPTPLETEPSLIPDEDDRDEAEDDVVAPDLAVHFSSETAEHYTPPVIIDAAIACLGAIDLDPCSNPGTPNVPAARHFTIADDGLQQTWAGRVYMNPPYGREIEAWVEKLCHEHEHGAVEEAIALLPARPDTQWFNLLVGHLCCFVEGRLTFIGNENPAPFPSAVFYLGNRQTSFYYNFEAIGRIWQVVHPAMLADDAD